MYGKIILIPCPLLFACTSYKNTIIYNNKENTLNKNCIAYTKIMSGTLKFIFSHTKYYIIVQYKSVFPLKLFYQQFSPFRWYIYPI